MPLTACETIDAIPADSYNECNQPEKPKKPYTSKSVAKFIVLQAQVIDKCKALLGKE